ncbi:MAG: EAL domain-containing protein [Hyphomicrobiales bacterium]
MAVVALAVSAGLHVQGGLGFAAALAIGVGMFLVMAMAQFALGSRGAAAPAPMLPADQSAQLAELQATVNRFAAKIEQLDRFAARSEEFDALSSRIRDMESINIKPNEIETLVLRVRQIDRLSAEIDRMDSRLEALRTQMQIESRERHDQLSGELQELGALVKHLADGLADQEEYRTRHLPAAAPQGALPPQPSARLAPPDPVQREARTGARPQAPARPDMPARSETAARPQAPARNRPAPPRPEDVMRQPQTAPAASTAAHSAPKPGRQRPAQAPAPHAPHDMAGHDNVDALLLDQVRKAIDGNRVELFLQPIMALPQRRVRFYEALTRLRNEAGELMRPDQYLHVAEASGAISAIDNVMLYRSVQVLRRLEQRSQARGLYCNLSMKSLLDADFFPEFIAFLDENRELAQNLFFEFPQAVIETAGPIELESLSVLASLGFRFSVDQVTDLDVDFKTLHDRGFRTVKLSSDIFPGRMAEVGARIHPADMRTYLERFGMRLIVEKIEDENGLGAVIDHDVRLGQGYLFSEPRPVRPEIFGSRREVRAA